eukprot:3780140-Pyramimonas_sp.AAC.1
MPAPAAAPNLITQRRPSGLDQEAQIPHGPPGEQATWPCICWFPGNLQRSAEATQLSTTLQSKL